MKGFDSGFRDRCAFLKGCRPISRVHGGQDGIIIGSCYLRKNPAMSIGHSASPLLIFGVVISPSNEVWAKRSE